MIASASASSDTPSASTTFADQQLDVEAEPGDADAVERVGRDHARRRTCRGPSVSRRHEPPTNDLPADDAAGELGMADVDARVDHRDLDARRGRAAARQKSQARSCSRYHCLAVVAARCSRTRACADAVEPRHVRGAAHVRARADARAARGRARACGRPEAARRRRRSGPAARRRPSAPASASAGRAERGEHEPQRSARLTRPPAAARRRARARGRAPSARGTSRGRRRRRRRTSRWCRASRWRRSPTSAPLCRWSCTGGARQRRAAPCRCTAPAFTDASTTGSTVRLTSAARTSPAASRYSRRRLAAGRRP